jgi:hypothetical protein
MAKELTRRDIPWSTFSNKEMLRDRVPLERETMVVGDVPTVRFALGRLGIAFPEWEDYPPSLQSWLRRRTWTSTVGRIREQVLAGEIGPTFVKPKGRVKRFTGFVLEPGGSFGRFQDASAKTEVYCAEPVQWRSEHRFYVCRGEIRGRGDYYGRPEITPDQAVVETAIRTFVDDGDAPAGFGIDFGVLTTGETALVEVNDGYSLGNYLFDDAAYADTLIARWEELVDGAVNG